MMNMNKINGFKKEQIFKLYDYLVAYEDSGIEMYNSTKALLKDHPELSELKEIIKKVECKKSDSIEMKDIDLKNINNEIYLTKCKGNLLLSFLAHLRNSIAHGNIFAHDSHILVTDFANPKFNPIDFAARGRIEFSVIIDLTNILKSIEL